MIRAELLEPKFNDFFPRIIRNQGYRRLYSLNEWSVDKWKEDREKILNNEAFVLRLSESKIKSPTILVTPKNQLLNYIKPTQLMNLPYQLTAAPASCLSVIIM